MEVLLQQLSETFVDEAAASEVVVTAAATTVVVVLMINKSTKKQPKINPISVKKSIQNQKKSNLSTIQDNRNSGWDRAYI